jgi:hypothetical protein
MEENSQFVKDCFALKVGQSLTREHVSFDDLFNLKYPVEYLADPMWTDRWDMYEIIAVTTTPHQMGEENTATYHICPAGSTVLVWMVSRLGDIGITDNFDNAHGYWERINPDLLHNWTIKKMRK